MKDKALAEAGKAIISAFFKRTEEDTIDDAELLPFVKDVINGISEQSTEADKTQEQLIGFAKERYTDLCHKLRDEDDNDGDQRMEDEKYFEYVYKNEKHPD